jgi:hypothetical protein
VGRPLKSGLDYFQHDVTMSIDEKMEALEAVHGNDGYAVYNKLLERIFKSGGNLDLADDVQRLSIAKKCNVTAEKFGGILADAIRFHLFDPQPWQENRQLTSRRIREQLQLVEEQRVYWREKSNSGEFSRGKTTLFQQENPHSPQRKVHKAEQSRGEESRATAEQRKSAAAAFSISAFRELLLACPDYQFSFKNGMLEQLYLRLLSKGCAEPGYLRFCFSKMRASQKTIANPSGYLKTAILEYDDWVDEWRKQAKCPECGMAGGYHIESCSQFKKQLPIPGDFEDDTPF